VILVLVEHECGAPTELTAQALAFARSLAADEPVDCVGCIAPSQEIASDHLGPGTLHLGEHEAYGSFAPDAVAATVAEVAGRTGARAVVGPGSDTGNDVLARVAARLDQPLAANCVAATAGEPARVTRTRWGGSLLEEAELDGTPLLLTVQPHAVAADAAAAAVSNVERFTPALAEADLAVRVTDRVEAAGGGIALADAKVVVSGGRGVGSTEGFAIIEELAGLLEAAVGCSRAVTMAGWRPHTDQVGQTGTKIAPELYIPCGISGATQHMAGCKGAKRILAIVDDPEAPILAGADYAVIGDLHEIVPAISAELRKARGS
jgi:electron transfer flavoprotein alpha subunit